MTSPLPGSSADRQGILEWYRPSPYPVLARIWGVAIAMLLFGMVCTALALDFLQQLTDTARVVAGVLAFLGVAGAPTFMVVRMKPVLDDRRCLTVRHRGLEWTADDGRQVAVAWQALDAIRWDGEREAVVLEREGAPDIVLRERFSDVSGEELVERLIDNRRRALMGLL